MPGRIAGDPRERPCNLRRFISFCALAIHPFDRLIKRLRGDVMCRQEQMETLLPAFQEDGHHVEQFAEWATPADVLLERADARAAVRSCIAQLPDAYRQVLLLRDIEELSTDEVARMLGATPTAVKVRLHRARQALSTLLRREFAR